MKRVETIAKYAAMMTDLGYSIGDSPKILLKQDDHCYATATGADFANITESDIEDMTCYDGIENEVLEELSEMNALVVALTPYASICIAANREIPAVLDDMAQIIGQRVCIVDDDKKHIARALSKAAGVMTRDGKVITCGRNLYEAFVAMTVLEKNAEVTLKAAVLGGAKEIGTIDAKLMREIYKKKYSKAEKEHKDESEG